MSYILTTDDLLNHIFFIQKSIEFQFCSRTEVAKITNPCVTIFEMRTYSFHWDHQSFDTGTEKCLASVVQFKEDVCKIVWNNPWSGMPYDPFYMLLPYCQRVELEF